MLSNIGRAAIRRAGLSNTATSRVGNWTWQLQRVCVSQNSSEASQKSFSPSSGTATSLRRSYATASTTATKSGVKRTSTAKTTKKPAAKKVTKSKTKPKKKAVAKKAPVKKVLTEAEKTKRAELKAKAHIKELKQRALLHPPKMLPSTAWLVLVVDSFKSLDPNVGSKDKILTAIPTAAATYKNLSPSEREHYNHLANQNKAANEIAYKQWVESHTPDQIREANLARSQLKRKVALKRPGLEPIKDTRQPKQSISARNFFLKERFASGDLKGIPFGEASKRVGKEWAALSPAEKKTYEDMAATSKLRYQQEYKTVFHRDPPTTTAATV